ncbi:MAG TPA: hypothetical protein VHB72_03605 [Candidatus Saccharimonadales bacterium]|nr:hypothetical protein [Candidatus Saccharimonadales bacterium]
MQEKTGKWIPPDSNETQYSAGHHGWQLVEHAAFLEVRDPGLGTYAISDRPEAQLVRDIVMSPLGLRGMSVTQLSKLKQHAPIPNIYDFYRTGHILSNYEGVHRLAPKHPGKPSEEEVLSWKLSVMLDDLAHGIASHLTDMIIEGGFGGKEQAHQERAQEAWRYGGIYEVLQKHGINVNASGGIEGYERPPWIESDIPELCYERVQYTAEEMRLWMESEDEDPDAERIINALYDLDNLTITEDGELAFKDEEMALLFSKAFLLLSTEDWNEPVNRVIEHLIIEGFKYSTYNRRLPQMHRYDNGHTARLESYTYAIDQDFDYALRISRDKQDNFMFAISQLLSQIAKEERWRFVEYKRDQFKRFLLDPRAEDYPSAWLNGHVMEYGPASSIVEIDVKPPTKKELQAVKTGRANAAKLIHTTKRGVRYDIQPMKRRYVDPLIMTANGAKRLSEVNSIYSGLLDQHARIHASTLKVRLAVSDEYERLIHQVTQRNRDEAKVDRPYLKRDQLRWQIDAAAERSRDAALQAGRLVLDAP